jgi:hypothetical protein
LKAGFLREAACSPELLFERYEQLKREHLNTERVCTEAGFKFVPMIIEAHGGGWSPLARRTLDWFARKAAAASGEGKGEVSLRMAQRLSCILQKENARAILRRETSRPTAPQPSAWAQGGDVWQ